MSNIFSIKKPLLSLRSSCGREESSGFFYSEKIQNEEGKIKPTTLISKEENNNYTNNFK